MRTHGTLAAYNFGLEPGSDFSKGCRCRECRDANRDYELNRRRMMNRPDMVWMPYVPAGRARRHMYHLREQGVGLKTVAAVSGVAHGALWKLMYGKTMPDGSRRLSKRIRPETEAAILAVTADQAADGAKVDATETWRLLDDLLAQGFYKGWLGQQVHGGEAKALQVSRRLVLASTARRVAEVHAEWSGKTPPRKRSRHDGVAA